MTYSILGNIGETPKQRWRTKLRESLSSTIVEGYYTNLLRTGDTKEANNPIDNVMCQDFLITVIFGCESELWRLRFGAN